MFIEMLCESECHQPWIFRGSDISTHSHVWLGSVGVLCQSARSAQEFDEKKNMKRWNRVTATYDIFPYAHSRVSFQNVVAPNILKQAYPQPLIVSVRHHFASLLMHTNILDRGCHFESGTFINMHKDHDDSYWVDTLSLWLFRSTDKRCNQSGYVLRLPQCCKRHTSFSPVLETEYYRGSWFIL